MSETVYFKLNQLNKKQGLIVKAIKFYRNCKVGIMEANLLICIG